MGDVFYFLFREGGRGIMMKNLGLSAQKKKKQNTSIYGDDIFIFKLDVSINIHI